MKQRDFVIDFDFFKLLLMYLELQFVINVCRQRGRMAKVP